MLRLLSDAANHQALKGLFVALRGRVPVQVTLVRADEAAPARLPLLQGPNIPAPGIFDGNEMTKLLSGLGGDASAELPHPMRHHHHLHSGELAQAQHALAVEQWLSWEATEFTRDVKAT